MAKTKALALKEIPEDLRSHIANIKMMSFNGAAAAGAITATGLEAGDVVLAVIGISAGQLGDKASSFEQVISVAGQIQQIQAANLSANAYIAFVI